jgi:hypothetical protein
VERLCDCSDGRSRPVVVSWVATRSSLSTALSWLLFVVLRDGVARGVRQRVGLRDGVASVVTLSDRGAAVLQRLEPPTYYTPTMGGIAHHCSCIR